MQILRDTSMVFRYYLTSTLQAPVWVLVGLFQPVLWLLLFAPLLEPLTASLEGSGDALSVFAPGVLIMVALFGVLFVPFQMLTDWRAGVLERLLVTPASSTALVLGRVLRDVLALALQSIVLLAVATLLGLRPDPIGALLLVLVVMLVGSFIACCTYAFALAIRDDNGVASVVNAMTLPLFLLSGIVLPLTLAPTWMRVTANLNPLYHAVEGGRSLIAGSLTAAPVLRSLILSALLAALGLWWVVTLLRKSVR